MTSHSIRLSISGWLEADRRASLPSYLTPDDIIDQIVDTVDGSPIFVRPSTIARFSSVGVSLDPSSGTMSRLPVTSQKTTNVSTVHLLPHCSRVQTSSLAVLYFWRRPLPTDLLRCRHEGLPPGYSWRTFQGPTKVSFAPELGVPTNHWLLLSMPDQVNAPLVKW